MGLLQKRRTLGMVMTLGSVIVSSYAFLGLPTPIFAFDQCFPGNGPCPVGTPNPYPPDCQNDDSCMYCDGLSCDCGGGESGVCNGGGCTLCGAGGGGDGAYCGNGITDLGEDCDDGNNVNNDN